MGYHDHCLRVCPYLVLEPLHRFQIQMVGRLIQKQNVRSCRKQSQKQDLCLLSPGKRRKLFLAVFHLKAKPGEMFVKVRNKGSVVGRLFRNRLLDSSFPYEHLRRLFRILRCSRLGKTADRHSPRYMNLRLRVSVSCVRPAASVEHLKKRRLSGSIFPYYGNLLCPPDTEGEILQNRMSAPAHRGIADLKKHRLRTLRTCSAAETGCPSQSGTERRRRTSSSCPQAPSQAFPSEASRLLRLRRTLLSHTAEQ